MRSVDHLDPSHIVHRYRYLDASTGHWKTTRHHMSAESAERFFAPENCTHFKAERWEPVESTREDRSNGLPMHGPGISCNPPTSAPPPEAPPRSTPSRLTVEEIRAIWERNKSPEVRRLIWELWYLRSTVQLARYIATVVEVAGIDAAFADRLRDLNTAMCSHPSPEALAWTSAEEAALKRIAKARR